MISKTQYHSQLAASTDNSVKKNTSNIGIVVDVILDDTHPSLSKRQQYQLELFSDKDLTPVYGVKVRLFSDMVNSTKHLSVYKPYDITDLEIPIVGELVEVVNTNLGGLFYKRIPSYLLNKGTSELNRIDNVFFQKENLDTSSEYNIALKTGIKTEIDSITESNKQFGKYFTHNPVNRLKLYEGDRIIQSRFGQSIRFSAYNNSQNIFSPTLIIRNRQDQQNIIPEGDLVEENINNDGSIIVLSSGEYQIPFIATTSIGPNKFSTYPNELKGDDHLLLNSGKIIISAKSGEMIFHSKKDYGFISDGKISIDNGLGGELDFGDDLIITTDRNDSNITLQTGNGKIFLNTDSTGKSPNSDNLTEPLVRGNTLKSILEELIELIVNQVYKTPSGPTSIGPVNTPEFNALKRRLNEMLSTLNYTE